jgi:hypothetical protein
LRYASIWLKEVDKLTYDEVAGGGGGSKVALHDRVILWIWASYWMEQVLRFTVSNGEDERQLTITVLS